MSLGSEEYGCLTVPSRETPCRPNTSKPHMKIFLAGLVLLFSAWALEAQDAPPTAPSRGGCGPSEGQYEVTTNKNEHPAGQLEPGKALVYVIEDIERGPTMRVGVDGAWVGANKGKSYFFFSLDPGDHQLCTKWQSGIFKKTADRMGSATTLTVERGKTYYLRVQAYQRSERDWTVKLDPVETAEGQFLVSSASYSSSRPTR